MQHGGIPMTGAIFVHYSATRYNQVVLRCAVPVPSCREMFAMPHEDKRLPNEQLQSDSTENADSNLPYDTAAYPGSSRKFVAYTVKLPAEQLAALQSIWLELKRLYGSNSPDKSGMIQQAVDDWLKRWDGPERQQLLQDLLEIRQDTRRRQYRKTL